MAHTPGPWSVVLNGDFHRIKVNGSTVYSVADVTSPDYQCISPPRHCVDDLLLMAAAPELLAALREAMSALIDLYEESFPDDESDNDTTEVIDRAFAAINKAEGRGE